jgi:hypothetical protein
VPVPEELQVMIRRSLSKDVKGRYRTAESMIDALNAARQVLDERETQATLLMRPAAVRARPYRRLWIAASAVGLVSVGLAAVNLGSAGHSADSGKQPAVATDTSAPPLSSLAVTTRSVSESTFAPLRRSALDTRSRASQAGATASLLAAGDSLAREAEGLAALGRHAEAVERLAAATTQWQAARDRASARKKPAQPVDLRTAAQAVATHLADAVAAKEVEAIRSLYPNLASDEHDRFVQFFQSNDIIHATLKADSVASLDRRANAIIRGEYDYLQLKDLKRKREPVEYRATFELTPSGWRLTMIRGGLFKK